MIKINGNATVYYVMSSSIYGAIAVGIHICVGNSSTLVKECSKVLGLLRFTTGTMESKNNLKKLNNNKR